jgi:hypothetical protein
MTSTFFIVLIIAVLMALSLIIVIVRHLWNYEKTERLLAAFEHTAAEYSFSIVNRQVLGNRVIGYDDTNNKLLFVMLNGNKQGEYLVNLEEIKSCMVIESYGTVKNRTVLGADIKMIALQLNYKNGSKPLHLPFYHKTTDPVFEIKEKAELAKQWQALLSANMQKAMEKTKDKKYGRLRILSMVNEISLNQ